MSNCENGSNSPSCQKAVEAMRIFYTQEWLTKRELFELLARKQLCKNCPVAQWRETLTESTTSQAGDFGNDF